jgi:antigen flippase
MSSRELQRAAKDVRVRAIGGTDGRERYSAAVNRLTVVNFVVAKLRWIGAAKTSSSAVAYSLLSRAFVLVVGLATGVIVARTLGPTGRGISGAVSLWPPVVAGLLTFGVPAAIRYEVRRKVDSPSEIFSVALLLSAILGVIAFVSGFVILPIMLRKYPHGVVDFARLMMLFAPLILANASLQGFYDSQGDFKRSNAMNYAPPLLTLLSLIVLYATRHLTPYAVTLAYEAPFACITVTNLFILRSSLRLPRNLSTRAKSLLHYGTRAYGIDILNTLAGQIDQAMVVGLLSAHSFGLYVVAITGSRSLSLIASSLNTVLFPKAAGLERADAISLVARSARFVFLGTTLAAILLNILLPFLIPFAFGREYASIVGVTQLLTIAVVLGSAGYTLAQAFMATGRPEIVTILQASGVAATAPLMLLLIPRYGLHGAAYAVIFSNVIRVALVLMAYPVFLKSRVPRLVPSRQDLTDIFSRLRRAAA